MYINFFKKFIMTDRFLRLQICNHTVVRTLYDLRPHYVLNTKKILPSYLQIHMDGVIQIHKLLNLIKSRFMKRNVRHIGFPCPQEFIYLEVN